MDNTKDILAAVRCHKGFTADRIARELGIAITTYQSYERGAALPPIKVLSKLADIYGLTTDQLIGRVPIRKQDMEGMEIPVSQTDLKAFTMAAMQGLIAQGDIKRVCEVGERLKTDYVGAIAKMSIEIARATLSELQKQQS